MKTGYALTALGMVNALGRTTETIWQRIKNADLSSRGAPVGKAAVDLTVSEPLAQYACRNNALTEAAYRQIKPQVRAAIERYGAQRVGVVMGSSTSGMEATEAAFLEHQQTGHCPPDFNYIQHEMGGVSEFLAALAQVDGPAYTISTACSSSAKVFASARALLRDGWCDAVLVGGADSLCALTAQGFAVLEALSDSPCNSMSRNRNGFTVGEGAAVFLLERSAQGIQLTGVGESSDAYHMSAPEPEGHGAAAAMRAALHDAGLEAQAIDYIHLHGTGTPLNDQMESRAVARLFAKTPASSSKGMLGHTLGAAGAMNVGLCWLALTHAKAGVVHLPPHLWDGQVDETLPPLALVQKGQSLPAAPHRAFLSNAFGFGGSNCTVIIEQAYDA
jgi:3-oxoacyl-[acyl-carrier-protein] synthase-1